MKGILAMLLFWLEKHFNNFLPTKIKNKQTNKNQWMRTTLRNQVRQFYQVRKFCFSHFFFLHWHKLLFLRCFIRFFYIPTAYETRIKMCMYEEKIWTEVLSLHCFVLFWLCSSSGHSKGGPPAQHSNSSMTSMTIVRGPVRIRLLTVR